MKRRTRATKAQMARRRARATSQHSHHIKVTYGLTTIEYGKIKEFQGGRCYICQRATGARKRLSVDHCHATGLIRGLLCSTCNKMLGHVRDDPTTVKRIIEYLACPPAVQAIGERYVPKEDDEEIA